MDKTDNTELAAMPDNIEREAVACNVPNPNFQTVVEIPDLIRWLVDLQAGRWTWCKNSQCKYITIGIDTRSGVYLLKDRDGNALTPQQMNYQLGDHLTGDSQNG